MLPTLEELNEVIDRSIQADKALLGAIEIIESGRVHNSDARPISRNTMNPLVLAGVYLSSRGLSPNCGSSFTIGDDPDDFEDDDFDDFGDDDVDDALSLSRPTETKRPRLRLHIWMTSEMRPKSLRVAEPSQSLEATNPLPSSDELSQMVDQVVIANARLMELIDVIGCSQLADEAETECDHASALKGVLLSCGLWPNGGGALTIYGDEFQRATGYQLTCRRLRLHVWLSKQVELSCVSAADGTEHGHVRCPWR